MSHQVLARKWRPRTFADIVGQQHIVRALTHALEHNRLHHAYLLTGTRGVGKTTFARILAKCLNCEQGITATPCLTCASCAAIEQGQFIDLMEIDAASRTRVEDTRDLLDNVQYMPTVGRYKIYLIDEVHMLSNHSFNALLKTLEEPPAHVIFILATTDPERLPITVLSRCLQFQLKSMTVEQISGRLADILHAEKVAFIPAALPAIAKAANGSMRDALSLLDQVIAFSQGNITESSVIELLGGVTEEVIIQLLQAVASSNGNALLATIQQLQVDGVDFIHVLDVLLEILHQVSIIQLVPNTAEVYAASAAMIALTQQLSKETTQLYYQIALHSKRDLPYAPTPRLGFEMCMLRMLAFAPVPTVEQTLLPPIATPRAASPSPVKTASPTPPQAAAMDAPATPIVAKKSVDTSIDWAAVVPQLDAPGPAKLLANYSVLQSFEGDSIVLLLDGSQGAMLNSISQQKLTDALSSYFNRTIYVKITVGASGLPCPANLDKQTKEAWQQSAQQKLAADPGLQLLIQRFDATIEPGSVKPIYEEK
jgi:DNA polymerase-3 subunit gamma/tau